MAWVQGSTKRALPLEGIAANPVCPSQPASTPHFSEDCSMASAIESVLQETRVFPPSADLVKKAEEAVAKRK